MTENRTVRSCCICFEHGKRCKKFLARHLRMEDGNTEYRGIIIGLDLCDACIKEYHNLAKKGFMPVTLTEDRDEELSRYEWTTEASSDV